MNRQTVVSFILLVFTDISLRYLLSHFIITDELIFDQFKQNISFQNIETLIRNNEILDYYRYLLLPFFYLFKILILNMWILSASILLGYKTTFEEIFKIVLNAEFIWLIPPFITLIWFGFIDTDYTLMDIQYFKPLSMLNFFDASGIEGWLIVPLQSLNLFEIAYMFVLAIGIKGVLKESYTQALNFTVPVYGSALVTWIVLITFLSINLAL